MPTIHYPINLASGQSAQIAPADKNRNSMIIQNYLSQTVNPGQGVMYVAFGATATAGTGGELEIPPGGSYPYGNNLLPNNTTPLKNYPLESISVFASGGAVVGCVIVTD